VEVLSFQPTTMRAVMDFVAQRKHSRGFFTAPRPRSGPADAAAVAASKWATMREAAQVYGAIEGANDILAEWKVCLGDGVVAEAKRLDSFLDVVALEVGKVAFFAEPLREDMYAHGIPWDENVMLKMQWAAQNALRPLVAAVVDLANDMIK
jgi:hypothetical protein